MPIDMGSISALATSLQSAVEIMKALNGMHDAAAMREKVIELQGVILSAQTSALTAQRDQFTLSERVRELEEQIAKMEEWDVEKQRYELTSISDGAFAYVLRQEMRGTAPAYWLCQNCFENRHKSVLQDQGRPKQGRGRLYKCPRCSGSMIVHRSIESLQSPVGDFGGNVEH